MRQDSANHEQQGDAEEKMNSRCSEREHAGVATEEDTGQGVSQNSRPIECTHKCVTPLMETVKSRRTAAKERRERGNSVLTTLRWKSM